MPVVLCTGYIACVRWRGLGPVSGPMTNSPHVVVAGTRRVLSPEQKRIILAETDGPAATASEVACRHGLHSSLLFRWRRALLAEQQAAAAAVPPSFQPRTDNLQEVISDIRYCHCCVLWTLKPWSVQ